VTVLFSDSGSPVVEATTKVALVVARGALAATKVFSTSGDDAPAAMRDELVQETEPVPTHVQPGELVPVDVIPTGSVAVTVMGPAASDVPALITLRLYASAVPATTGAMCVAAMETSADVTDEDASVALLLAGTESGVPEDTEAVLLTVLGKREADTFTMSSTDEVVRAAMVGPVQVTVVVVPAQVHEPALAEAKVMPAGSTSVRVMGPTASDGALLVTASVYVTGWPAVMVPMCVTSIDRSASAMTTPGLVVALLAGVGSVVIPATVPLTSTAPSSAAAGATMSWIDTEPLTAMPLPDTASTQETVPVPVQVQPVLGVEISVMPVGSVAVNVNGPSAKDGPLLVADKV
jgi:hypothetical protein